MGHSYAVGTTTYPRVIMDGYFALLGVHGSVQTRVSPKHLFFSAVGGDVTCMIGTLSKSDGNGKDDVKKQ